MSDTITWKGDKERPLMVQRPCPCGCDFKDPSIGTFVGYITGSDAEGNGFTTFLRTEDAFQAALGTVNA